MRNDPKWGESADDWNLGEGEAYDFDNNEKDDSRYHHMGFFDEAQEERDAEDESDMWG